MQCLTPTTVFFFFNDTATTEIYTLSLHDALPICLTANAGLGGPGTVTDKSPGRGRSEEHTSELQSRLHLVCRLLLEKKKTNVDIDDVSRCSIMDGHDTSISSSIAPSVRTGLACTA